MTSTFLLTLHFEWALTIFLTVARGYVFCPGAMISNLKLQELSVELDVMAKLLIEASFVDLGDNKLSAPPSLYYI